MDLRCSLQSFLLNHLKSIRNTGSKNIVNFINFLNDVHLILSENELPQLKGYLPVVIKREFCASFYSSVLEEVLSQFDDPELFQHPDLNLFKSASVGVIEQTNYEDSFLVLVKMCSVLK
jgi:hypothetical protein